MGRAKARPYSHCRLGGRSERICRRSGATTETEPQPKHTHGDERPKGIQQGIVRRSGATGHKRLVNLIQHGIAGRAEQRRESPGPPPAAARAAHRAIEKQAKNEILAEVRALSDEIMKGQKLSFGHPRLEPTQNRLEDRSGVLGGKRVRGHQKNHSGPQDRRPPGPQPRKRAGRWGSGAQFSHIWCWTRIAPRLRFRH